MNRKRTLLIGLLALGVAAVLTVITLRTVRNAIATGSRPMTKVVVAATDLNVGMKLEEKDVRTIDMLTSSLPQGAHSNPAEVLGRGVITPIQANELLLDSKLAAEKAGAGLSPMIPPKMRAVSVKVNEIISVAGFVVPGTRVDVLLTGYPGERRGPGDAITATVLENVQVLAAGQKLERDEQGKPQTVTAITLLVSPDDAERLVLASAEGKIQLALRHPFDVEMAKPAAVRSAALYGRAPAREPLTVATRGSARPKKASPPPATPPIYMVEVIKGDKRDLAKF